MHPIPTRSGKATLLGVFLGRLPRIPLATQSGEETASQGAAPNAPAQFRAPPTKRPFERGEVVEAEVHPPPLQRRRPQEPQQERRRIVLRPAAKGAAPASQSTPLRVPKPAVLPERSRPQRVVPEAVDGELEGEARQARTRARSPKPKVSTASSPPPVPKKVSPRQIRRVYPRRLLLRLPLRQTLRVPRTRSS